MRTPGVVYTDRWDRRVYSELSGKAPVLQSLSERGAKELEVFSQLLMDLWATLFKADPLLKPKEQVRPVERMSRVVAEKLFEAQQYLELREFTTLDEFATTLALPILGEAALEVLLKKQEQLQQLQQQQEQADGMEQAAGQAGQAAADAQAQADDLADQAAQAQAEEAEGAEQLAQQAQAAQQWANELGQQAQSAQLTFEQAQELLEQQAQALLGEFEGQAGEELRRAMRSAAKEALNQTEETSELLAVWGVEPGEVQALSYEEKLELANRIKNSKRLKEVAKLAGRFRRLALAKQKEKVRRRAGKVVNIKRGRDLRRLIPHERRLLAHPFQRLNFLRRYSTHSLWVYEVEDEDTLGEGPVIWCLDESGSMSEEQQIWLKAVSLGMFEAARHQKRTFVYIHYGGPGDPLFIKEIRPGQATYKDLVEIAEYYLGGGTDFEKPLAKALEYIEKGLPADVLFGTDGQCAVSTAFLTRFNKARKEIPFSCYSVLINQGGSVSSATVEKFSDEVLEVSELSTEEAAEVFSWA